jgi:hypothetical protein
MPRPSMIPTVQGKLIYLLQWAEREGYVYVAAELRDALRMLGEKEIPPHPVPPEVREAMSEYLAREFPGTGKDRLSERR